ncbi:MAG: STAS domain-containing protein [Candidatus Dormibacteria bacterium]
MEHKFGVEIVPAGDAVVLALAGDVDGGSTELGEAYDRATAGSGRQEVILDFTAVEYINSSGIALIVSVLARARAAKRHMAAVGLTDHYRQIFEITRLSDFIELRQGPAEPTGLAESAGRPQAAGEV